MFSIADAADLLVGPHRAKVRLCANRAKAKRHYHRKVRGAGSEGDI